MEVQELYDFLKDKDEKVYDNLVLVDSKNINDFTASDGIKIVEKNIQANVDGETITVDNQGRLCFNNNCISDIIEEGDNVSITGIGKISAIGYTYDKTKQSFAEGVHSTASGAQSHAEGGGTYASNTYAHAEGSNTFATGQHSHAEGGETVAKGESSHTEGYASFTFGYASHAENSSIAYGDRSHAEGAFTTAYCSASHVEGYDMLRSQGDGVLIERVLEDGEFVWYFSISHESKHIKVGDMFFDKDEENVYQITRLTPEPELDRVVVNFQNNPEAETTLHEIRGGAFGIASHSEGINTITKNTSEHAEGQFNVSHHHTIHSTGIGDSNENRKNAFEILDDGSIFIYGIGNYDGTSLDNKNTIQDVINNGLNLQWTTV